MASPSTHSPETVRNPPIVRRFAVVLAVVLLLAIIAWLGSSLLSNPAILPPDDFVEYWAAGRLNATGHDPFDPEQLLPLQRLAGRGTDEAIMMWNPPWTLPLVMPFGLLPARVAQLSWLLLHLVIVLFCADGLWRFYQGPTKLRWVSWLLALTFLPTAFVLQAGQITPLLLLGVVGFLYFHKRHGWLAGACCLLIAVKPHLLYLFWLALLLWGIRERRWSVFLGGIVAGGIATGIAVLCNPSVLAQYHDALTNRPPEQWVSPTPGAMLRLIFGKDPFWLQFLPILAGLIWFVPHWIRHRRTWDWGEQSPLLIMVSLVTACYGAWPFDLVVLLLPTLQIAVRIVQRPTRATVSASLGCWLIINGLALTMNILHYPSFWFIWMTPAVLLGYLVLRALASARLRAEGV